MITLRPSAERLHTRLDWLDSRHTFSFGEHHDARFMGFRALRVINEDRVAPGQGFGTHPHRDMEIVTYVLDGVLEHQDSLGTGATIKPGDVQRMTAGTGVLHSEYNGSKTERVHFIQIWVRPDRKRLPPGYEQRSFPEADRDGQLRLIGLIEKAAVIDRILRHLGVPTEIPSPRPARAPPLPVESPDQAGWNDRASVFDSCS